MDDTPHNDTAGPHHEPAGPLARLFRRASPTQISLFALAASLFLHAILALIGALIWLDRSTPALGSPEGDVRLAVMTAEQLSDTLAQQQSDTTDDLQLETPELEPIEVPEYADPVSSTFSSLRTSDLASDSPSANIGNASGDLSAFSGAASGGGGARFFGVEARGSRFAYICDVSGSMEGRRIDGLRAALTNSVDGLLEHANFTIILFNSEALPLTGGRWVAATDIQKQQLRTQLRAVSPSGGTNPIPAFQIAFQLKPRPDAIYFMTDGRFSPEVADQIVATVDRLNRAAGKRSAIHCITFGSDDAQQLMRRIARLSGGSYTHVEGPPR